MHKAVEAADTKLSFLQIKDTITTCMQVKSVQDSPLIDYGFTTIV